MLADSTTFAVVAIEVIIPITLPTNNASPVAVIKPFASITIPLPPVKEATTLEFVKYWLVPSARFDVV